MRRREFITLLGGADLRRGELLLASAHLVLNFRNPAPPSPRGVLANATPRRFPLRLITRNLTFVLQQLFQISLERGLCFNHRIEETS